MNLSKWLHFVEQVVPLVLASSPLAPIAPFVILGIKTAEQIPGASGPAKLALAQTIVRAGVSATNAQAGHQEIDPTAVDQLLTSSINAVVAATNLRHTT